MKEHCLYRHFDEQGNVLYIGVSICVVARLYGHKKASWVHLISRIEVERFETRELALIEGTNAILKEQPIYNIAKKIKSTRKPYVFKKEQIFSNISKSEVLNYLANGDAIKSAKLLRYADNYKFKTMQEKITVAMFSSILNRMKLNKIKIPKHWKKFS